MAQNYFLPLTCVPSTCVRQSLINKWGNFSAKKKREKKNLFIHIYKLYIIIEFRQTSFVCFSSNFFLGQSWFAIEGAYCSLFFSFYAIFAISASDFNEIISNMFLSRYAILCFKRNIQKKQIPFAQIKYLRYVWSFWWDVSHFTKNTYVWNYLNKYIVQIKYLRYVWSFWWP
jgi:hypothetical protein